jgi:hypothetical protein
MDIKKEINATIDYWLDDILFYFNESGKSYYEVAQIFKNVFSQRINKLEKELNNEEEMQ